MEGPVWYPAKNLLLFVSIFDRLIYLFNLSDGSIKSYKTEGPVGCAFLENDYTILEAELSGIYRIDVHTGKRNFVIQLNDNTHLRYNDGKMDPCGRLLVGTMEYSQPSPGEACLYSFDGTICKKIIQETTISNGIAFSKDETTMYFVDTPTKKVCQYEYDKNTGDAKFQRPIIEITGSGFPDGICLDKEGMLWVAEWGGGEICRWNCTTGKKLDTIKLPCKNVSSCCLVGENEQYLYVTTGKQNINNESVAGGLFRVKL